MTVPEGVRKCSVEGIEEERGGGSTLLLALPPLELPFCGFIDFPLGRLSALAEASGRGVP